MTKANKAGSPAIIGEGKNGSSTRIVAAGLAMLITLWVGNARDSAAKGDPGIRSGDLKMSVRVYNYAGSSADLVRLAESEAERIFARAGVHLEWHECVITSPADSADPTCATPLMPSDLQLRIVKSMNLKRAHLSAEAIGLTLGDLATVQMEPLQNPELPMARFSYHMLARAIAHELGHTLLGPGHSSQGIMRACWGKEQLDFTAANDMVFTPDQEKALRLAVKERHAGKPEALQANAQESGTRPADLKMSVRVYNYGGSSADLVSLAESETERIFARAGVRLEWHECGGMALAESADPTCATPLTPSELILRIVTRVNFVRIHASAENIGFAFGNMATVQMEPLQKFQSCERPAVCFSYQMLARAMAHEFGHALLGPGHSSQGIMRANWGEEQLEFTAANDMVFTPDQEKALQLAVKARHAGKPEGFQADAQELAARRER